MIFGSGSGMFGVHFSHFTSGTIRVYTLDMVEQINQPVSVLYLHNKNKKTMLPVRITWNNRMYTINKVGFHYKTVKSGDVKHFFYVTAGESYFKISLDTKTLETVLEEAGDGLPS